MRRFFYPDSLVVIGVSERSDNLARNIIFNLHNFGYKGRVFAVGRKSGMVHGIPIAPSLDAVPDALDLAVVLTPAATIPDLMEACGRKGIQRVVIESGGFGEFSQEGHALERRILEIARKWNIRFVGPNCISVINLETGLCLPFTPVSPATARVGPASVVSQSGGVSITYLDRLCTAGVGVNKGVSIGNKTDLNEADYLTYLLQDDSTKIVCMYLESTSNGRELMDLARSAKKPVIVHKTNRTQASQRAAHSHTAALADDDRIIAAAFRQAGIIRSENFRDTIAIAQGLALPPVKGDNLVIISRSGGHAVIAADAAENYGFQLPSLPDQLVRSVRALSSANVIALTNPLDLGTIFNFDLYANVVEQCLQTLSPDAILLVNAYSLDEAEGAHRLAQRAGEIVRKSGLPIAFCVYSQGEERQATQNLTSLPIFAEIEDAMRGLAASRQWHNRQRRQPEKAERTVQSPNETSHKSIKPGILTAEDALLLCSAYDIPIASFKVVSDSESAVQAAQSLGFPVALKTVTRELMHKTDLGGVALGLANPSEVKREAETMKARFGYSSQLMVQQMTSGGLEVILGGKRDRSFGPVVMFGLGGIYVEVFGDVAFGVAPLTHADAEEMIGEVRGRQLIDGARGKLPLDRNALIQALLRVSHMLVENPSLNELDINPLLVFETGVLALDARAIVKENGAAE